MAAAGRAVASVWRAQAVVRAAGGCERQHAGVVGWAWKLGAEASEASFLDVVVEEPEAAPDFQLDIDGVRVLVPLGFDAGELRRLVDALC